MLSVFSLDDSKWQPLYLSSLYVIGIFFGRQQVAVSLFEQLAYLQYYYISINEYISENLAEKLVMNHYLQKSVICHQQFDTLCLSLTLGCKLTVLGQ